MRFTLLLLVWIACLNARATVYEVPAGDVGAWFAKLPADATVVNFSGAGPYKSVGDIPLPPGRLLVIDGKGCRLILGSISNGFTCAVADQKEATARVNGRYEILNFAEIQGGRKAFDLKATLGSRICNVNLVRQTEVAVDLRFCLMARLEHVFVTNPAGKGIVLRQGDWPGASAYNSQCNSTVLDQCRVYASKTTTNAYEVQNSNGVHMTDCVSEGAPVDHDLFLSAVTDGNEDQPASNPVVKSFSMENFHVEHAARIASIHVNMPSKASVSLRNIYWNGAQPAPVIRYVMGQLTLSDIGWWKPEFRIVTRISAPRIHAERCHSALDLGDPKAKTDTRAGVLELRDPMPNNTQLKLNYVIVRDKAM